MPTKTSTKKSTKVVKRVTKADKAKVIVEKNWESTPGVIIGKIEKSLDMTRGTSSTYYYNALKKIHAETA